MIQTVTTNVPGARNQYIMAGYAQRAAEYFAAYPDFHTYTFNFLPKEGQYHAVRMGNDVMIVQLGTLALTIFELAMLPALKTEQKAREVQETLKIKAAFDKRWTDIGLGPPSPWVNTPRPIAPDRYSSFSTDIDINNFIRTGDADFLRAMAKSTPPTP